MDSTTASFFIVLGILVVGLLAIGLYLVFKRDPKPEEGAGFAQPAAYSQPSTAGAPQVIYVQQQPKPRGLLSRPIDWIALVLIIIIAAGVIIPRLIGTAAPCTDQNKIKFLSDVNQITLKLKAIDPAGRPADKVTQLKALREQAAQIYAPDCAVELRDLQVKLFDEAIGALNGETTEVVNTSYQFDADRAAFLASLSPAAPILHNISLRVTGTARVAMITYGNAQGGTEQRDVSLPWAVNYQMAPYTSASILAQKKEEFGIDHLRGLERRRAVEDFHFDRSLCNSDLFCDGRAAVSQ